MSMIRVEDLTFSYPSGSENIFENVSFQIDTDWKLGFIGRNAGSTNTGGRSRLLYSLIIFRIRLTIKTG